MKTYRVEICAHRDSFMETWAVLETGLTWETAHRCLAILWMANERARIVPEGGREVRP